MDNNALVILGEALPVLDGLQPLNNIIWWSLPKSLFKIAH